jgi:hypothetical protein
LRPWRAEEKRVGKRKEELRSQVAGEGCDDDENGDEKYRKDEESLADDGAKMA